MTMKKKTAATSRKSPCDSGNTQRSAPTKFNPNSSIQSNNSAGAMGTTKAKTQEPSSKTTNRRSHPYRKKNRIKEAEWEENFRELESFKARYGHCRVPCRGSSGTRSLYVWLHNVRSYKRQGLRVGGILDQDRIDRLNALGVEWFTKFSMNDESGSQARDSIEDNVCRDIVLKTRNYGDGVGNDEDGERYIRVISDSKPSIRSSGNGQEKTSTSGIPTPSLLSFSDDGCPSVSSLQTPIPGMVRPDFTAHFTKLQRFHEIYGNSNVPDTEEWIHLAQWLYCMKRCRHDNYSDRPQLTPYEVDCLESLGVSWYDDSEKASKRSSGGTFSCKIKLIRDTMVFQDIGAIKLPLDATFAEARRQVMDSFCLFMEWSFYIPFRGPLTLKEEVSVGSMYPLLVGLGANRQFCFPHDTELLIGRSPTTHKRLKK